MLGALGTGISRYVGGCALYTQALAMQVTVDAPTGASAAVDAHVQQQAVLDAVLSHMQA